MDEPKDIMKQLLIKPEKCIGCRTCELVCSFGHHNEFNPKMANVKVFEYEQAAVAIPMMCLQCDEAACMKVCPVKAISQESASAVRCARTHVRSETSPIIRHFAESSSAISVKVSRNARRSARAKRSSMKRSTRLPRDVNW